MEVSITDKPSLRLLLKPELKDPVLIEGLPGFGEVGKLAAGLLIKFINAKLFAELYSPYFPDHVVIKEDGISRLPCYEFFASTTCVPNIVVLTGDLQPSPEEIVGHYDLCGMILDFAQSVNCKKIITLGGYPDQTPGASGIYVAATSESLTASLAGQGASIYKGGRIVGAAGLVLGLAKIRGLEGVCILGATPGIFPDNAAAMAVFQFLIKVLGLKQP